MKNKIHARLTARQQLAELQLAEILRVLKHLSDFGLISFGLRSNLVVTSDSVLLIVTRRKSCKTTFKTRELKLCQICLTCFCLISPL